MLLMEEAQADFPVANEEVTRFVVDKTWSDFT